MLAAALAVAVGTAPPPPPFDLALEKVTAVRWPDEVLFECDVVLRNNTGKPAAVRSSFNTVYDRAVIVVRDKDGKFLCKTWYVVHLSPYSFRGEEVPVKVGENRDTIKFPVRLPAGLTEFRVMIYGTLPGVSDDVLITDVVAVTVGKE